MELFENSGADFSNDGKYRYKLWRIWDESLPRAMCIGLNPSTANADKNDQTISYLILMLKKLGYGGFYMMNCWAYITSNPRMLKHNPMSDEWNNNVIALTARECQDVIFSWGGFDIIKDTGRGAELAGMFPEAKCFGWNKDGSPFHPLAMMPRNGRDPNKPELFLYSAKKWKLNLKN